MENSFLCQDCLWHYDAKIRTEVLETQDLVGTHGTDGCRSIPADVYGITGGRKPLRRRM